MNPGSVLVLLVLIAVVVLDIRYLMKNRSSCSHDCSQCGSSCRWSEDLQRARKDLAAEKEKTAL